VVEIRQSTLPEIIETEHRLVISAAPRADQQKDGGCCGAPGGTSVRRVARQVEGSDHECLSLSTRGLSSAGDRRFESGSLQQRVLCELDFRKPAAAAAAPPGLSPIVAHATQLDSRAS
jgi:hypothetical protein